MESNLLRGICIGLLFGLPVGAVGALTVQRNLAYGSRMGILTGLGLSLADCFYAVVGALGLTLISDGLMQYQTAINIVGGAFVLLLGIQTFFRKPEETSTEYKPWDILQIFAYSFAIGITNPAAIFTFLFAFSWFGIVGPLHVGNGVFLVLGIFLGTIFCWLTLSGCATVPKSKLDKKAFQHMHT